MNCILNSASFKSTCTDMNDILFAVANLPNWHSIDPVELC